VRFLPPVKPSNCSLVGNPLDGFSGNLNSFESEQDLAVFFLDPHSLLSSEALHS
jgi:hypothetical protein